MSGMLVVLSYGLGTVAGFVVIARAGASTIAELTAAGRPAVPDDIAKAVRFLLSDDAAAISGTVLDVGCHTGALGAAYRRLNPTARLLGIEGDAQTAAIAATRLDDVRVVDLEVLLDGDREEERALLCPDESLHLDDWASLIRSEVHILAEVAAAPLR